MALQLRTLVVLLLIVAAGVGLYLARGVLLRASEGPCDQLISRYCPPEAMGACVALRRQARAARDVDPASCEAALADPVILEDLSAPDGRPRFRYPLPFRPERWVAFMAERPRACALWAGRLQATGAAEQLVEAARAHPDADACTRARFDAGAARALREVLARPLIGAPYDGPAPCAELARRVTLFTGEKVVLKAIDYLISTRCRAALSVDGVVAFANTRHNVDDLPEVEIDAERLPWIQAADARLDEAVLRSCRRWPLGAGALKSRAPVLRSRCLQGLRLPKKDRPRFIVENAQWVAPDLVGLPPDLLSGPVPWPEGRLPKGAGGRMEGACAELGVKLCARQPRELCDRVARGMVDRPETECAALSERVAEAQAVLSVAGHVAKRGAKPRILKLPGAWKAAAPAVQSADGHVTRYLYLVEGGPAPVVKALKRALKRARVRVPGEELNARGGTMVGIARGFAVELEVLDADGHTWVRLVENDRRAERKQRKRRR